jgi:ABC-type transport system involved in multi-copper enzyme maturation permease subunit
VNLTLILATLRQRFTSPLRLLLLLVLGWMPMLPLLIAPRSGFTVLGDCYFLALTLATGMIGQDLSSGTLQLLLARPVTRAQYVSSRWGAVAAGTFLVVVLQTLCAALIMTLRGAPVPWAGAAVFLANGALLAIGTAAVMALLSSLASGIADLGLLFLVWLSAQVLEKVGMLKSWEWLARGAGELLRVLKPELDLAPFFHAGPIPWLAVVSYLSTVTLCLGLAVVVMNRRELSYASSGN